MLTNSELLANFLQWYPVCWLGSLKLNWRQQNSIVCRLHIITGKQFNKETVNHEVQGAKLRFDWLERLIQCFDGDIKTYALCRWLWLQ